MIIEKLSQRKPHSAIFAVLLTAILLGIIALIIDEILVLGFEKRYILCGSVLALFIGLGVLTFKSYRFCQEIKKFTLELWNSNHIKDEMEFAIVDNKGKVILSNTDKMIEFYNNSFKEFIESKDKPSNENVNEFITAGKIIKLQKLKDICNINSQLSNSILITIQPNLKKHPSEIIAQLQVPACATDNNGNLIAANQILLDIAKTSDPASLQLKIFGDILSLYTDQKKISDFFKIEICSNENEISYILLPLTHTNEDLPILSDRYPLPALTIDKNLKIVEANMSFYILLGLEKGVTLENFVNYVDDNSKAVLTEHISKTELNSIESFEIKFKQNQIIGRMYMTYIHKNGYFLCHIINITDYKNIEMNFIHSQKMQAIGQLAGGIAHDFNNLLTAMIGFCDLLLIRHPAGDPSFADIMQIKQNSNRAANLVRQLLAISRKQVLRPQILDITNIIAELANLIRRLIGENITLKMNYGRDLMLVRADQGQLEQVIMNLAVNARDAIGSTKGTLSINTSTVNIEDPKSLSKDLIMPVAKESIAPGKYVLIEVSDTGSGIPKEIIDKIFEPFFSTKEIGAGTGLGLSTVYGIIKQTGGYLYVLSTEGKGTSFYIYLKAVDEKTLPATRVASTSNLDLDSESKLIQQDLTGNSTILLVEDEVPVRMFSSHALANKGYKILESETGEEALNIMKNRGSEVSLIITDVIMPGMNGPTLITEIQKTYPAVKVIFMSGYAEEAFSKTYGIDGDFHFLSKPFTLKQLATKVKEVLSSEKKS